MAGAKWSEEGYGRFNQCLPREKGQNMKKQGTVSRLRTLL